MSQIQGRITYKKMIDWVNEQFIKFEINNYEAYKVERTYFTSDQYSGGACKLKVYFQAKDKNSRSLYKNDYFMCFFFLHEYQDHIKDGYEMYLRFNTRGLNLLRDLEVDLRKK